MENTDGSEIYSRRNNAKDMLIRQQGDEFIYFLQMAQQNCQEETTNSENPLRREQAVRRENLRGEFQGEPEESQPTELKDDAEARTDFWSIEGVFIYRRHNEPEFNYVPKEVTFRIPLKFIDVHHYTH